MAENFDQSYAFRKRDGQSKGHSHSFWPSHETEQRAYRVGIYRRVGNHGNWGERKLVALGVLGHDRGNEACWHSEASIMKSCERLNQDK